MKIRFLLGLIMMSLSSVVAAFAQVKPPQFINESALGPIGSGYAVFTLGFVIQAAPGIPPASAASLSDRVLLRGIGPGLTKFGVPNTTRDPKIIVYNGSGTVVATNDDWNNDPAIALVESQVGAFPLDPNSRDAALVIDLHPGLYTMQIVDTSSVNGQKVIGEVYDVTRNTGLVRLGNMSVRSIDQVTIGFVTDGKGAKPVLIRAVGPTLVQFGLSSVVADPRLTVFDNHGVIIAQNDNWSASLAQVFASVGAFPLPQGSKDAALTLTINVNEPTSITAIGDRLGVGPFPAQVLLVEMYDLSQ